MFLPNKNERYTASLRNYIQNEILKKGLSKKHIEKLKKIITFEAVNFEITSLPCDIKFLSSKLLIAAYSRAIEKKEALDFSVKIKGNHIINIKLFSIVLLTLALSSDKIEVNEIFGNIFLKCKTDLKINHKLLKALNAVLFYEKKSKSFGLIIKADKTDKKSVDIGKEWEISNPFSLVNIFLS